jgi:hypothetical protein
MKGRRRKRKEIKKTRKGGKKGKKKRQRDKLTQCNCPLQPKNFTLCNLERADHQSVRSPGAIQIKVSQFSRTNLCVVLWEK